MRSFKIMTYNIHSGIGRDRRYRLDRIIEVIAGENPEVMTLQEVDNNLRAFGAERARTPAPAPPVA
jgi:endonuclease/exonuclease/phosphatase family metal-dependent hydrolase